MKVERNEVVDDLDERMDNIEYHEPGPRPQEHTYFYCAPMTRAGDMMTKNKGIARITPAMCEARCRRVHPRYPDQNMCPHGHDEPGECPAYNKGVTADENPG